MKRSASAFTLIELLVVISIIALLIGILLPALSGARDSAKVVACASNLRQVAIGVASYAADEKDFLPPNQRPDVTATPYVIGRTFETRELMTFASGAPTVPRYQNHGLLFGKDYVTTGEVYYCPSMEQPEFTFGFYPEPWGTNPTAGFYRIRSAYHYNPRREDPTVSPAEAAYKQLTDFIDRDVIALDLTEGNSAVDPVVAHINVPMWNVAFNDGSVSSDKEEDALTYALNNWTIHGPDFNRYDTFLDILMDN